MTKKHFEAIANIFHAHVSMLESEGEIANDRELASDFADYFATLNPNFDRRHFLTACGF